MSKKPPNPRAPMFALQEAIEYGQQVYDQTLCHVVDVDSVAVALGYKDSRNGAAQTKMGTLKYYGILESHGRGKLAVSDKLQTFKYTPSQAEQAQIAKEFLQHPKVFSAILRKFDGHLPSDAILKLFLIKENGFDPSRAEEVLQTFRSSFSFVESFDEGKSSELPDQGVADEDDSRPHNDEEPPSIDRGEGGLAKGDDTAPGYDRIPVRLPKGRKAWLTIPHDFSKDDKPWVIKQLEAIWVEE
jgi:hypothetical protein